MDISFGLVKPESIAYWSDITAFIESRALVIVEPTWIEWRDAALTERVVRALYPDAPEPIIKETARRFYRQTTPFFKVAGTNAVHRFLEVCGTAKEPLLCAAHTLRREFGDESFHEFFEDGTWYRYYANVIHRPKDQREAQRDIGIFYEKTRALA